MDRPPSFDQALLAQMGQLLAFASRLCRDHVTAEDLVQAAVCRALERWSQFQPGTNLAAWTTTILRNEFYSRARRDGRMVEDPDGLLAAMIAVPGSQESAVDLRIVESRMRQLPARQRAILELFVFGEGNMEMVAEQLGVPVGTVKSSVSRARDFLESGNLESLAEAAPIAAGDRAGEIAVRYRAGESVSEIARALSLDKLDVLDVLTELRLRRR